MTILDMLHEIEKKKCIYNIHYCRAGVGFQFFEPPDGVDVSPLNDKWKKYLTTNKYYPTFEAAVKAEFKRLKK